MLRKCFFVLVAFASFGVAQAQQIFSEGTTAINAGVGVGSSISNVTFPPLSVSLDYSLKDNLINGNNGAISIGGLVGYVGSGFHLYNSRYSASHAILGVRGAFHYQFVPRLDTYAGAMLSYNIVSGRWTNTPVPEVKTTASGLDFGIYLGARYFISEQWGAFAELGYGIAFLNLGVTYRL